MSGFIHGFRYNTRVLCNYLLEKKFGVPLSPVALIVNADVIANLVIRQINQSDGLFLQPGMIVDLFSVDFGSNTTQYFKELSFPIVFNEHMRNETHHYVLSMEYGQF